MSGTRSGKTFWIVNTYTQQFFAFPTEGGWIFKKLISTIYSTEERERLHGYSTIEASGFENQQDHDPTKACSYCRCICLPLLWAVFNIYMIVIGAVEPCAAGVGAAGLYLMVQGGFNLLHLILCILAAWAAAMDEELLERTLSVRHTLFISFLFAWTIGGSVFVFMAVDDNDDDSQCNDVLLISALICLSLHYVLLLLPCCCYFCYKCMKYYDS